MGDVADIGKEIVKQVLVEPWPALGVGSVCGLILLIPPWLLANLRLDGFLAANGQWVGLGCLLGFFFAGIGLIRHVYSKQMRSAGVAAVKRRRGERAEREANEAHAKRECAERKALTHLETLNACEADLLLSGVQANSRTVGCSRDYPQGHMLVAMGLLAKVPAAKDAGSESFIILDFVWQRITTPDATANLRKQSGKVA